MSLHVTVDKVTKAFNGPKGRESILNGVSFSLDQGETLSICGKSGVGKTTLLRIIAGLHTPDSGSVLIMGKDPKEHYPRIGFVGQDYSRSLLPWFRVESNVALALINSGLPKKDRVRVANEWLAEVGLHSSGKKYPWQLSGGMQQRVAIARALATRPTLLCLDEPFGALDAQTRIELQDLILRLSRKHSITSVLVTHDLDEAIFMADKVLVLTGSGPEQKILDVPLSYPRDRVKILRSGAYSELRSLLASLIQATSQ